MQLVDLLPELIILLAEFLSPAEEACLALCNRRFSHILGPRAWHALKILDSKDCLEFLSLWAADLPHLFPCHICVQFHRCSYVKWPQFNYSNSTLQDINLQDINVRNFYPRYFNPHYINHCIHKAGEYRPLTTGSFSVDFAHVQLVMKRHYYGSNHGIPLDAFFHTEVEERSDLKLVTLLSVDATIVANELLVRSQLWMMLPRHRCQEFLTIYVFHLFCYHFCISAEGHEIASDQIRSALEQLDKYGSCRLETQQCPECFMDFTLEAFNFKHGGIAFWATRWINLGSGIDPGDDRWRSHLSRSSRSPGAINRPPDMGSTRASFESNTSESVQKLTKGNIRKLFSKRKREFIRYGDDGIGWKMDFSLPHLCRWRFIPPQSREGGCDRHLGY